MADEEEEGNTNPITEPFKRWLVVLYRDRDGRMSIPLPGYEPYLQFMPTTMTGSTGCNHFLCNFRILGDRIDVALVGTTLMGCLDPPQLLAQEQDFLDCLSKAFRLKLEDEELSIYDTDGRPLLRFHRDPNWP